MRMAWAREPWDRQGCKSCLIPSSTPESEVLCAVTCAAALYMLLYGMPAAPVGGGLVGALPHSGWTSKMFMTKCVGKPMLMLLIRLLEEYGDIMHSRRDWQF